MWKRITIENNEYLTKWVDDSERYKIFITDIINVWMEELDNTTLLERWKELNPLLEADTESSTSYLRSLISGAEDATLITNVNEQRRTLHIQSKVADIDFCFILRMKKMESDTVFQQLIFPLIMVTKKLYREHQHLCDIIKHKDAEIEQYKFEGATLKRKKLETKPFDEKDLEEFSDSFLLKTLNRNYTDLFEPWLCEYITKVESSVHPTSDQSSDVQQHSEMHQQTLAVTKELPSENTICKPTVSKNEIRKIEMKEEPVLCEEVGNSFNADNSIVKRKIPTKRKPKLKF